jgi:hypothetical protein
MRLEKTQLIVFLIASHLTVMAQVELASFFNADDYGIRPEKMHELLAIKESGRSPLLRAGASALIAAQHLEGNEFSDDYTDMRAFADFAVTNCVASTEWPAIYARLAVVLSYSTGHEHDYIWQTNHIVVLMADVEHSNWDSSGNPVYMHSPRNGYQMSRIEIQKILRSLLVQSYCWLKEFDLAKSITDNVVELKEQEELNKNIKAHMPREAPPVGATDKASFAETTCETSSTVIDENAPIGGDEISDNINAVTHNKRSGSMIGILFTFGITIIVYAFYKKRRLGV